MSFSVMVTFLGLGILVQFVPKLTETFEHGRNCLHSACAAQSFILIFFRYVISNLRYWNLVLKSS